MKEVLGWWLPDTEEHYIKKLKKNGHYQRRELEHALSFVPQFNLALDIGGNIGFWSKLLAEKFQMVYAFEPVYRFRECFLKNVTEHNVFLFDYGFSDKQEVKTIQWDPKATGGALVSKSEMHILKGNHTEKCEFVTLENFGSEHILEKIDFIKLDCEGYEYFILKGGEELIKEHKPVINIEDKFDRYGLERGEALRLLESWGATLLGRCYDDCVYGWV